LPITPRQETSSFPPNSRDVNLRRSLLALAAAAMTATAVVSLPARAETTDPPYSVETADLEAALECRGASAAAVPPEDLAYLHNVTREPVLLVHGTFTNGAENYRWALAEALAADGFSPCWVTYPNRGLDDMQVASEYVVHAIGRLAGVTGRQVDVLGHSQGALLPRWAVRFWPETARANVDDLVLLAGPQHGTEAVQGYGLFGDQGRCQPQLCTEAMWQFDTRAAFIAAMNSGQETFEEHDVTSIYTEFDELVRPVESAVLSDPVPETPNVVNILFQDLCPARPVDHASMFIDHVMYRLATNAFANDGPADPATITTVDCAQLTFQGANPVLALQVGLESFTEQKGFDWNPSDGEPPLKDYASGGV
jgi:triacylglycerol esterase/lipase EstA (alpha/beta hydrolase family)